MAVHTFSNFVPGLSETIEEIDTDIAGRNATIQYQDEGVDVSTKGAIQYINFTGTGVAVTSPSAGTLVVTVSTGAEAFIDLSDVPASYAGEGGRAVAVNLGETGLEFVDFPSSGSGLTQPQVMARSLGC